MSLLYDVGYTVSKLMFSLQTKKVDGDLYCHFHLMDELFLHVPSFQLYNGVCLIGFGATH